MDISGKVFVVTGAGNGIGREVTFRLLAQGAPSPASTSMRSVSTRRPASRGPVAVSPRTS